MTKELLSRLETSKEKLKSKSAHRSTGSPLSNSSGQNAWEYILLYWTEKIINHIKARKYSYTLLAVTLLILLYKLRPGIFSRLLRTSGAEHEFVN